jgi:hypothetical protein
MPLRAAAAIGEFVPHPIYDNFNARARAKIVKLHCARPLAQTPGAIFSLAREK